MRYNPASGNAEGFLQYHFPAEGGSALKYQPLPGITNAGFAGCVEVTLEYNLQELTATAAFDGGAVLTVNNVSQKLRSGDLAGLNQLVGANLFAGVLASAQGGSKKDNVWCFKSFFFAQAFIEAPRGRGVPRRQSAALHRAAAGRFRGADGHLQHPRLHQPAGLRDQVEARELELRPHPDGAAP